MADASRRLVAWVVEGQSVPGFRNAYPDAQWMPNTKRFFVICDSLPPEVPLSTDPRVQRVTAQEYEALFETHGFGETDYITIELKSESTRTIVLEFTNVFGPLAGHGYRFEFRRTLIGLRATGQLLWVS